MALRILIYVLLTLFFLDLPLYYFKIAEKKIKEFNQN